MDKKVKFAIISAILGLVFFLFLFLPTELRYVPLAVGVFLVVFCYWFGLGVIFETKWFDKIALVILPSGLFVGLGLLAMMFPQSFWLMLLFSLFFGALCYVIFLVDNVFIVAIGFKTVPLYRAAYTVSLILTMLMSFLLFNNIFSYKVEFYWNFVSVFLVSILLFWYQFWSIAIELADDGKSKKIYQYVLVPSLLIAELGLTLSFWPVGIFKASILLVSGVYIISGLIQADVKDTLRRRVWTQFGLMGMAIILAIIYITPWG
jgi:hypothetical protein